MYMYIQYICIVLCTWNSHIIGLHEISYALLSFSVIPRDWHLKIVKGCIAVLNQRGRQRH